MKKTIREFLESYQKQNVTHLEILGLELAVKSIVSENAGWTDKGHLNVEVIDQETGCEIRSIYILEGQYVAYELWDEDKKVDLLVVPATQATDREYWVSYKKMLL